ncbi:MAG: hypothetical protein JO352_00790, partial [Chloroflexi bacterium]|nr:hypothetical protein [Chloroflexota bacterium]
MATRTFPVSGAVGAPATSDAGKIGVATCDLEGEASARLALRGLDAAANAEPDRARIEGRLFEARGGGKPAAPGRRERIRSERRMQGVDGKRARQFAAQRHTL